MDSIDLFKEYRVRPKKNRLKINSGFPLNFYGSEYDNIPLNDIQLILSLLLAGLCQRSPLYNGICELDKDIQYAILNKYFCLQQCGSIHSEGLR